MESDSFLDVVANIVGILIILIVIVGTKVGRSAREQAEFVEPPAAVAVVPVVAPRPVFVIPPVPAVPVASPELLSGIRDAEDQLLVLAEQAEAADRDLGRANAEAGRVREALASRAAEAALVESQFVSADADGERIAAEVASLEATLESLGQQSADVPAERVEVIKHKLNPISREVSGDELHFRISEGRIAEVPIKALIERLKPEIERQKEWIARYRQHRGQIGPVDGFLLDYLVERQRLTVVEELQQGAAMMRIGVAKWEVTPTRDLVTESADEALRSDSRFRSALRLAPGDATLTMWVYPDSFAEYRKLQAFAHAKGFTVAARPLPAGVPIAGSPSGSKSTSQ